MSSSKLRGIVRLPAGSGTFRTIGSGTCWPQAATVRTGKTGPTMPNYEEGRAQTWHSRSGMVPALSHGRVTDAPVLTAVHSYSRQALRSRRNRSGGQ